MYNRKSTIKVLIVILLEFFLISCTFKDRFFGTFRDLKDQTEEKIKVYLSQIPLLGKKIKLAPPPKDLYKNCEEKISMLKLSSAKDLYKEEYERVLKIWEEAKKDYEKRYYNLAEKKLNKVNKEASALLTKIEEYEKMMRERALIRYKSLEKIVNGKSYKTEEEAIKAKLFLLKLKNLIDMGKFDEFEKEAENFSI